MELNFVRDLNESTMYRSRQQAQATDARDMIDFAFLNLLTLHILYNDYTTAPIAQGYAKRTMQYRNFDNYYQSATDLYVALNSIKTNSVAGGANAAIQMNRVNLPEAKIKQYLTLMSQGMPVPNPSTFLVQFERGMDIQDSNYRSIRRLAGSWPTLDNLQKGLVVTRLLQFYRTKAIRSELYGALNNFAKLNSLEIKGVDNAEAKSIKSKVATVAMNTAAIAGGFAAGRAFGKWLVK
jgi:hypothetical protein